MAVNNSSHQDSLPACGSSDFFLVEDAKAHEEGNKAFAKRLERLECLYLNMMIKSKNMAMTAKFLEKFWTAFLAFNSLVLPPLLVVVLGVLSFDPSISSADQMITNQYMMAVLVGFSMIFGLPFYMYTLSDLEDVLEKVQQYQNEMASTATQTAEVISQTATPNPSADSICKDREDDESESSTFTYPTTFD